MSGLPFFGEGDVYFDASTGECYVRRRGKWWQLSPETTTPPRPVKGEGASVGTRTHVVADGDCTTPPAL